jgi:hypothetical protein
MWPDLVSQGEGHELDARKTAHLTEEILNVADSC